MLAQYVKPFKSLAAAAIVFFKAFTLLLLCRLLLKYVKGLICAIMGYRYIFLVHQIRTSEILPSHRNYYITQGVTEDCSLVVVVK